MKQRMDPPASVSASTFRRPITKTVVMSDSATIPDIAYHLVLRSDEVPVPATAMRLLISDEVHHRQIRRLGREVLTALEAVPGQGGKLTMSLDPLQMKIMHSAVKILLEDQQREQASQREILRSILTKLPDEHTMRAIDLDAQAPPPGAPDPIVDNQAA